MSSKKQKGKAAAVKKSEKTGGSLKRIIIVICVLLAVAGATVAAVIIGVNQPESLGNSQWVPDSAKSASSDEAVPIEEISHTYYSNYQGSLSFKDDNTFEVWLSPGDASDGTHSGTYEVQGDTVKATYGDGTKTTFALKRDGTRISAVVMDYGEYKISFKRQEAGKQ